MPVNPNCPEPLKGALERMEASVQSCKRSLAYAAPEMQDTLWAELQHNLADILTELHEETRR